MDREEQKAEVNASDPLFTDKSLLSVPCEKDSGAEIKSYKPRQTSWTQQLNNNTPQGMTPGFMFITSIRFLLLHSYYQPYSTQKHANTDADTYFPYSQENEIKNTPNLSFV